MARLPHDFARVAVRRVTRCTPAGWGVVVSRYHAVGDYDVFFLFDFDETHGFGLPQAVGFERFGSWVCDRDLIRGTINVGFPKKIE